MPFVLSDDAPISFSRNRNREEGIGVGAGLDANASFLSACHPHPHLHSQDSFEYEKRNHYIIPMIMLVVVKRILSAELWCIQQKKRNNEKPLCQQCFGRVPLDLEGEGEGVRVGGWMGEGEGVCGWMGEGEGLGG